MTRGRKRTKNTPSQSAVQNDDSAKVAGKVFNFLPLPYCT